MFAFVTIALFGALAQDPAPGGATAQAGAASDDTIDAEFEVKKDA